MPDLIIERSDNGIFSLQKIRACEVLSGNGVMRNKCAVACQMFDKSFQFDQHFFLQKNEEITAGSLL